MTFKEYRDEMKKIIADIITDGENPDEMKKIIAKLTNRRKEYRDEITRWNRLQFKHQTARCVTDGENPDKIKSGSVIKKLKANWIFYQKWTDGLLYRWFDAEGCFKIKTIERSYFTKFFELRKTPQGRKMLLNWARVENWRRSKKFSISKTEIEESSRLRGDLT